MIRARWTTLSGRLLPRAQVANVDCSSEDKVMMLALFMDPSGARRSPNVNLFMGHYTSRIDQLPCVADLSSQSQPGRSVRIGLLDGGFLAEHVPAGGSQPGFRKAGHAGGSRRAGGPVAVEVSGKRQLPDPRHRFRTGSGLGL